MIVGLRRKIAAHHSIGGAMPRGGKRPGAGRPAGSGRFRETTRQMRVPLSLVPAVDEMLRRHADGLAEKLASATSDVHLDLAGEWAERLIGPASALDVLAAVRDRKLNPRVVMLDPWYRAKSGQGRAAYLTEVLPLLEAAATVADHVFLWGFPEHVARVVDLWPQSLEFRGWITWFYKNAPTRARGWRPCQQVVLHLSRPGAEIYPKVGGDAAARHKLGFRLAPYSVIEVPLLAGFVGRAQQTGFVGQKPLEVIEPMLQMTVQPGDLIVDPTCGSGTTGEVARKLGCKFLLADRSTKALELARERLGVG